MRTSIGFLRKFLGALSALAMLFAASELVSCSSDSSDSEDDSTLSKVEITITGSATIEAAGNATLTAKPTFTGTDNSSGVTYKWEITSGSDYAFLSATSGLSIKITGKNTDSSSHTVTVKVTASYNGTSKNATKEITVLKAGETVKNELTGVTLSANPKSIEATGTSDLTAASKYTGTPTITYSWEITSGSDYASLNATSGESVTLTGKNTAASSQSVVVKVTASDGTNSKDDSATITVGAAASEAKKVSSVKISGSTSVKAGSSITLTATPDVETSSAYTWTIKSGTGTATGSSTTSTLTLTGATKGTVTVTASVDGVSSSAYTVTVTEAGASTTNYISASDTPTGYAGYGYETSPYYTGSNTITINASDTNAASTLQTYAKKGNYVIYINGMIDMTYNSTYGGSMLPTAWNDDNAALGKFIADQYDSSTMTSSDVSAYTSWSAWRQAYAAACTTSTDYDSKTAASASTIDRYQYQLITAWKKQIQIVVASNTTIIGLTSESGIKGGTISISGVSNVVIRNLHLQDAFDPFPHHETKSSGASDGWNAEYDCITVQGENSYIWIDHCTFEDTISVGWTNFAGVKTGSNVTAQAYSTSNKSYEMWQTYDGLCDIKGKSTNITVSYCVFRNHDKTMLIGSDDSEFSKGNTVSDSGRTITLHHNYFYGCVQRLPMARLSYIHNYNNYYGVNSSNGYDQKASVNARYGVYINSEYNYFDSGMKYSYNSSDSTANLYYANDYTASGVTTSLSNLTSSTSTPVFTVPYSYTSDATSTLQSDLEANAGAGKWTVKQ